MQTRSKQDLQWHSLCLALKYANKKQTRPAVTQRALSSEICTSYWLTSTRRSNLLLSVTNWGNYRNWVKKNVPQLVLLFMKFSLIKRLFWQKWINFLNMEHTGGLAVLISYMTRCISYEDLYRFQWLSCVLWQDVVLTRCLALHGMSVGPAQMLGGGVGEGQPLTVRLVIS